MCIDGQKNRLAASACWECGQPVIFGVSVAEPVKHPLCPACERAVAIKSTEALNGARLRLLGLLEPGSSASDQAARAELRAAVRELEVVIMALGAET